MARQRKMTEVVDAELLLKALYGSSEGGTMRPALSTKRSKRS